MPLAARPLWICLACSLLAPGIAWAQRPPQVRTPEEENARTEKDYLVLECVSERSATAAEKPPTTVAATGPQRIKWNNTSYNTTIYHVEGKTWEEKDNQSGKVKWQLTETDRTDEYIQLVNPTRKQSWRLTAKRMELKEGSDWKWLANGAWQPPSR